MSQKILIADDDVDVIAALTMYLKSEGFDVVSVSRPEDVIVQIEKDDFNVLLMDLNYSQDTTSGQEGLQLIEPIKKLDEYLPIVVMTGWGSVDIAVQAMKFGASDFIQKPWENERLLSTIKAQIRIGQSELKGLRLSEENQLLRNQLPTHHHNDGLIAESSAMKEVVETIQKLSQSDMNILITGENGTGKSMLADYLHQQSGRSSQPFISVNMGAIAENLFESEMFGHVKGAFTDAKQARIGRFELAEGGTLFLDEIANIPLSQQAKLLRVLEEKHFEKVGSPKTQLCNIRLVSATNADLDKLVEGGTFRKDLLYRLNTVEVKIPPLRERKQDIRPLAEYFLKENINKYQLEQLFINDEAYQTLENYYWPGNIRELSHMIERAVFLGRNSTIGKDSFNLLETDSKQNGSLSSTSSGVNFDEMTLDDLEKLWVLKRLNDCNGNALQAAKSLGLSRSAFYRRLEKYSK